MELFVSTSGTRSNSLHAATTLAENGYKNIELSGGSHITDLDSELELLIGQTDAIMLHNYFPPPKEPFVFNLASSNPETIALSISLAKSAIDISGNKGFNFFGIHAGFLVDPQVSELGNRIQASKLENRERALEIFTQNTLELSAYAESRSVRLLVENNVLSEENMKSFGEDPFLLSSTEEISIFFETHGDKVGFLLDLGHFNVSTNTLDEPREYSLERINQYVVGYHLHDNSRMSDQHLSLTDDSWFLNYLNTDAKFGTLEIHSQNILDIQTSVRILEGVL
jgi:sugar phosphate isomerase/epimerase